MKLPPFCGDDVDAYIATGDRKYLPRWSNAKAVLDLFREEDMTEWSSEWPRFDDDDPKARGAAAKKRKAERKAAFKKAKEEAIKKGDAAELLRLSQKGKGGRPKGSTSSMPLARRVARNPIHRAATMVPMAKSILADMYLEQAGNQIHDRAMLVVTHLCGGIVTVSQLEHHLARPKNDRRRIKSS